MQGVVKHLPLRTRTVPVWRLSHAAHRALYSVSMKLASLFLISMCAFAAAPTPDIKVDQVGYLPHSPKLAMVVSHILAKEFSVRRAGNDSVVFHGRLAEPANDPDSGDLIQTADFTKLDKPGKYYLEVPGVGRSWEFGIGPDVFARAEAGSSASARMYSRARFICPCGRI